MSRNVIFALLTFFSVQPALAQSTPTIAWRDNPPLPEVDDQFQIVGNGTIILPATSCSISIILHAMNTSTKRIYSGACSTDFADGKLTGTWTGKTRHRLPNGNYDVWVLLEFAEGIAKPRFFTGEIKQKAVTGSNVPAGRGGTIAFANLTRNGIMVTSTKGPYTLAEAPGQPPPVWHFSLAPVTAPFAMFAYPTPGGEVLAGSASQQPNNKWSGSVYPVPIRYKLLGTMAVKRDGTADGDDHVIGTGFVSSP